MSFDPNNHTFRNTALAAACVGSVLVAGCSSSSRHTAPKTSQSSSSETTPSSNGDALYPFTGKSSTGSLTIHPDGTGDFISTDINTGAVKFTVEGITCKSDGSIKTGTAKFAGEDKHYDSLNLSAKQTKKDDFCENGHLAGKALSDPFELGYELGINVPS